MSCGVKKYLKGMFTYIEHPILSPQVFLFLQHFVNEMDGIGGAVYDIMYEIDHHYTVIQQANNHLMNNYSTGIAGFLSHWQYLKMIRESSEQLVATYDASQLRISTGHIRLQAIMSDIETAIYQASDAPLPPRTAIGYQEFLEHVNAWGVDRTNVDVRFNILREVLADITTNVMQEFARVINPSYLSQSTAVINQQANLYMDAMNQECLAAVEQFQEFGDYYESYHWEARMLRGSIVSTLATSTTF